MAEIVESEYPQFIAALPADNRLPPSYTDWLAAVEREDLAHKANGLNTRRIIIGYREFTGFVKRIGMTPCYSALQTYARYMHRQTKATKRHFTTSPRRRKTDQHT